MKKNKTAGGLILLGCALLIAAVVLGIRTYMQEKSTETRMHSMIVTMQELIHEEEQTGALQYSGVMEIDGLDCVGYLVLEEDHTVLPVLSENEDEALMPRYVSGFKEGETFKIDRINTSVPAINTEVRFVDVSGNVYLFTVDNVLHGNGEGADLVLIFTTIRGNVTVLCSRL